MKKIYDAEFYDELIDNFIDMCGALDAIEGNVKRAVTMYSANMLPHYMEIGALCDKLRDALHQAENEITARHNEQHEDDKS